MEHSPSLRVRLPGPNGGPHRQERGPAAPLPTALPRRYRSVRYQSGTATPGPRFQSRGSLRSPPQACSPSSNPSTEPARFCSPNELYSAEKLAAIRQTAPVNQRRSHHGSEGALKEEIPRWNPASASGVAFISRPGPRRFREPHTFHPKHPGLSGQSRRFKNSFPLKTNIFRRRHLKSLAPAAE